MVIVLAAATLAAAVPAAPVRVLVETVDLSGLALSPDGRWLAFRTEAPSVDRNTIALGWHVADLEHGSVRTVADGGGARFSSAGVLLAERPVWAPGSDLFYYRALIGGAVGVWRASPLGKAAPVTDEPADVLSFALADGGASLHYDVGAPRAAIERAEQEQADTGVVVDATVDLAQEVVRGAIINGRPATERLTGAWFDRAGLLADGPPDHRQLALNGHSLARPAAAGPAVAPDSPLVAVAANGDRAIASRASQLRVERAGGAVRTCDAAVCRSKRTVALAWRPGRDQVLLTTEDPAHAQTLWLWSPASPKITKVASSAGLLAGGRDSASRCALTARYAFCVAATPGKPPRIERIDLDSGVRTTLFEPNRGQRTAPVRPEPLAWRDAGGQTFTGTFFRLSTPGRAPLVINYYRCDGDVRGGLGDEVPFAPLAASGIAALCINKPPSAERYDAVAAYDLALRGVSSAIDTLDAKGVIDRTRVGMAGLSFGSEVTTWVAMNSRLLSAASIASLQLEPAYYWYNAPLRPDVRANLRSIWGLGTPDETPQRWATLSPALNVHKIRAPLLMQLPEQEARLSVELFARLSASSTPTELVVFSAAPHIKTQPRQKQAAYQRTLDWFRFWLLGCRDENPAKASQYERWTALAGRTGAAVPPADPVRCALAP